MKALRIAFFLGISSFIIGIIGLSNSFLYCLTQKDLGLNSGNMSSYRMGEIGIIMCEIFIDMSFSIVALFLLINNNRKSMKKASVFVGMFRIILLLLMLIRYWNPGWYYILDTNGNNQYCYLLLSLAIAQSLSYFFVGKTNRSIVEF